MNYSTEEFQEYKYLEKRIEKDHFALDFFRFCELHRKIYKKTHPLCYYKSLLVSIRLGDPLTEHEKNLLVQLYIKYGEVNIEHIIMCSNDENWANKKGVMTELKSIFNDIIETGKKNKNDALAEFALLTRNNIDFSYNNPDNIPEYNSKANDELFQIFSHFETEELSLSETFVVKLTSSVLIHILTGHLEKFKIPRKGVLANFPDITEWYQIIYLLMCVLDQEKENIIHSFGTKNRYDNKSILYNGNSYGLHIQKNRCILSFYPVANYIR